MRRQRAAPGLDLDFEEVQGGMLVGRAAALADWEFRREQREFNKLIAVLRATKWNKDNPERRRQLARESAARRYAADPEKILAPARRRRAAKPREQLTCAECRGTFPRPRGGPRPRFCTDACRQRHNYQKRTPGARRIKRQKGRPG